MWLDYLENPQFIKTLFAQSPSLHRVAISALTLHVAGPVLLLRTYLPVRPDHLPRKWCQDANTVGFTLEFISIKFVAINGWSNDLQFEITIEKSELNYSIELTSEHSKTTFLCQFITIKDIEGYYSS